jgi:hypothetical protein
VKDQAGNQGELRCEEAQVLLSRELDRELRAADRERLEGHLASCAACSRERAELSQADGWLRDAFTGADAPDFGDALVRDIQRAVEVRKARPVAQPAAPRGAIVAFRAAAGLVAASAAAVLFVALATGSLGPGAGTGESHAPAAPAVLAKAYGKGLRLAVTSEGGSTGHALAEGEVVRADEHVLNASGPGTLVIGDPARVARFAPGDSDPELTRIDLRPDTVVAFHVERDGGVTVSFPESSGVAYFEVAKQEHPFRVATPVLTATVVGTRFVVEASSESSLVSVVEGRVRVTTSTQHVDLSPRQEAFFARKSGSLIARPSVPRALLSWNPRALATLPAEPTGVVSPPAQKPADPPAVKPTPKPVIDPDLDTPVK